MEPNSSFGALFMLAIRQQLSVTAMAQALIVAAVTAGVTSFTTVKVLEREMTYVRETLNKQEAEGRRMGEKLEIIRSRQDSAISQASVIHDNLDRRIQALEGRRR